MMFPRVLICFFAISAFIWGTGCITAKGPAAQNGVALSKIVTLEGKNFNKKDADAVKHGIKAA